MQALRDVMSHLQAKGAVVFGVSADTVEAQKAFADKQNILFPLLADPEKKMIAAYGALGNGGYPNRYTFVIGPDGKIRAIDKAVNGQFSREGGVLSSRHGQNLVLLLSDWKARLGQPIPGFSLLNYDGKTVSAFAPGKRATVILFMSKNCPVSRAYDARLRALASDPAFKDVAFLGINSNADETTAEVRAYAEEMKLPFPVAKDPNNDIADHFGAQVTPTVWVIDAKGIAVYTGAIDDNPDASAVKSFYLTDALNAVLAEKPVAVPETKAQGCSIKRVEKKSGVSGE
jgi:peroxiredoxin